MKPTKHLLSLALVAACKSRSPAPTPTARPVILQANSADSASVFTDATTEPSSPRPTVAHVQPTGSCRVERARHQRLHTGTVDLSIAATDQRALLVSTFMKDENETGCRERNDCLELWTNHEFHRTSTAWDIAAGATGSAREFRPAHSEYDPSCHTSACVDHRDFARATTRGTERLIYGISYAGDDQTASVFLGDLQGNRISSTPLVSPVGTSSTPLPRPLQSDVGRDVVAVAGNADTVLALHWGLTSLGEPAARVGECSEGAGLQALHCGSRYGLSSFVASGTQLRRTVLTETVVDTVAAGQAVSQARPFSMDLALNETGGAAVYNIGPSLYVRRFTSSGEASGPEQLLYRSASAELPYSPSVAMLGSTVYVLFSKQLVQGGPMVMHQIVLNGGAEIPAPSQVALPRQRVSAVTPTLSSHDGVLAVAWIELRSRSPTIFAGASSNSIDDAIARAVAIVPTRRDAKQVDIAWSDGRAWVSWSEAQSTSYDRMNPVLYLNSIVCDGPQPGQARDGG